MQFTALFSILAHTGMVRKQTEIVQPVDTDNFKRCAYQSCNIFNFVDHLKYWTDKKNDEVQKFTAIVSEFPNTDYNPPPLNKNKQPTFECNA